ncbi:branched-chain amino acid transaminase [Salinicoccus roseus]|uniref:Branched-chain-amino-acid aminotransferase n=1 Tax=Salinicoccus roseus TaxID=45670 RepID=A0A265E5K8_9STAP|nr:branched-chain amino acid transaminase [Salinicoccus roseus]OZT76872.1 branched-chain amino acid aminotransferase [Salinicoccus roseus]
MKNTNRLIWFNGEILPVDEAKINVLSPTSQFGINVFEGVRCYWNEEKEQLYIFKFNEHIKRLLNSVKLLSLECSYSEEELKEYFLETVKANDYREDITVRQTIFLDGQGSWSSTGPTSMFIAPIPKRRAFDFDKIGLNCSVSSWERIEDNAISPRIKVGANYLNSRMAQLEAVRNGYDTTILKNRQGKISEAPGSCLFIVRDNILITPSVTSSILESITRDLVIKLAREELGLKVIERDVDRTELYIADEAFLCGTAMEVVPVKMIDGYKINNCEGDITQAIRKLYFSIARNEFYNYKEWVTPVY